MRFKMKEKYFWATIIIVLLGIAYGAWLQIKDYDFASQCTEIAREEAYEIYSHKAEGSFIQVPPKITYKCKNGTIFIK